MERLYQRLQSADRALDTFYELVELEKPTTVERDAAIQRFEFSVEACWKAAKQFLYDIEGIDIGSPKGVIRSCREVDMLSEDETILGLHMVDHRNLTVHTYNEDLAIEIFSNLPQYYHLLRNWVDRLKNRLSAISDNGK